jgi:Zn-dependent protease with chaperone function
MPNSHNPNNDPFRSDKPLSGASRLALFCGAGVTIALCYILSTFSLVALLALIGLELLLAIVLARFGMARLIAGTIASHVALLGVLLRSFLLRKGAEYRIQIAETDAPGLFELLRQLCRKTHLEMPHEISIEMSTNAWVRLSGYRRGAGRTVLGIGFDLLAGLSQWEMEGVLAHEITHAKLVQRGYKSWMNRGLGRMGQLARGLHDHVEAHRKLSKSTEPAALLFRCVDRLTRLAARLVAACSRQDEFDADRGAADLCGAGAIRSSLLKLGPIGERAAHLPWNERVARLQIGEGFSRWLVEELSANDPQPAEDSKSYFFKYSSHPSLSDRLAALPQSTTEPNPDSSPAIALLKNPDQVAEALISRIQSIAAEEERKDSRRLRKWTRKGSLRTHLRPIQSLGVLFILVGVIFGFGLWSAGAMSLGIGCIVAGTICLGLLGFRFGRFRERLALSVPDFAVLKSVWETRIDFTQEQVKKLEAQLQSQVANISRKHKKELALAVIAYDALHNCDYLKAHIAARLCLHVNNKSIEGAAALAVAGAALGQLQQVHEALHFLHKVTGMSVPSLTWSAGWALLLCGDWAPAEAFLEKRCQQKPAHPTLSLLLALCQSNRGKLQSALLLARRVCEREPANVESTKFLIQLFLKAGYLREARERLQRLEPLLDNDREFIMMMVQLTLLLRDFEATDKWTERLKQKHPGPHLSLRLGFLHEVARQREKASRFYNDSLAGGFYPEALLGLARLEALAQNKALARQHLAAALNVDRALGEKAVGPLPLLHQILGLLLSLDEPVIDCRAWIAHLNGGKSPPGLANKLLLIYARSSQEAEVMLQSLFAKMQPGVPPIPNANIGWEPAGKEKQPDGPVRAGVQCILD